VGGACRAELKRDSSASTTAQQDPKTDPVKVLAGEIGGSTSRLALYNLDNDATAPSGDPLFEQTVSATEHTSVDAMLARFLSEARRAQGPDCHPSRACLGVAGPVTDNRAQITSLPWAVDSNQIQAQHKIERVTLVNDFHAVAHGVTVVGEEKLVSLGGGQRKLQGPVAVAGAATGLGEAFLFWSAENERYQVAASEGGHVDFTPRSGLETGLLAYMQGRYGRVSYENLLSHQGLIDIYSFLAGEPAIAPLVSETTRARMATEFGADVVIERAVATQATNQALGQADPVDNSDVVCAMAANLFGSILGGLCGNLALTFLTSGGVFVTGGIARRLETFLKNGVFRQAFESKGRFRPLIAPMPCFLVTHENIGLVGAASLAAHSL